MFQNKVCLLNFSTLRDLRFTYYTKKRFDNPVYLTSKQVWDWSTVTVQSTVCLYRWTSPNQNWRCSKVDTYQKYLVQESPSCSIERKPHMHPSWLFWISYLLPVSLRYSVFLLISNWRSRHRRHWTMDRFGKLFYRNWTFFVQGVTFHTFLHNLLTHCPYNIYFKYTE